MKFYQILEMLVIFEGNYDSALSEKTLFFGMQTNMIAPLFCKPCPTQAPRNYNSFDVAMLTNCSRFAQFNYQRVQKRMTQFICPSQ